MKEFQKQIFGRANSVRKILRVFVFLSTFSWLFTTCEIFNRSEVLIEDINMIEMADIHLPDFQLVRERPRDSIKTEFVFSRESDSASIFITIGIYGTTNNALDHALHYHTDISMVMHEGPHQEVMIGERFWWLQPYADYDYLTNIVFTRKNTLFIMSSHSYNELKSLAKKIDDDILNKNSYISFRK